MQIRCECDDAFFLQPGRLLKFTNGCAYTLFFRMVANNEKVRARLKIFGSVPTFNYIWHFFSHGKVKHGEKWTPKTAKRATNSLEKKLSNIVKTYFPFFFFCRLTWEKFCPRWRCKWFLRHRHLRPSPDCGGSVPQYAVCLVRVFKELHCRKMAHEWDRQIKSVLTIWDCVK